LLANLDGPALAEPRFIPFKPGRRLKMWHKNVVAIGLSGGFLEPLESTSIHLIQSGIAKLLSLFPTRECDPCTAEQYNRVTSEEIIGVRDFLLLHYHSTAEKTEPLWEFCRAMPLPQSLIDKEAHFCRTGRIVLTSDELFRDASWFAVLVGQGHQPKDYNPLIDSLNSAENLAYLRRIKETLRMTASRMRDHLSFLS
jgi:tryptophan halogenase